jgi:hypothetical protein
VRLSAPEPESFERSAVRIRFFAAPASGDEEVTDASFGADRPTGGWAIASGGGRRAFFSRTAAPKRSSKEAKRWSTRKRSSKEARGLLDAGGSDSSAADSKPTSVSKLATRTPERFGICDPRGPRRSEFSGRIVPKFEMYASTTPSGVGWAGPMRPQQSEGKPHSQRHDPCGDRAYPDVNQDSLVPTQRGCLVQVGTRRSALLRVPQFAVPENRAIAAKGRLGVRRERECLRVLRVEHSGGRESSKSKEAGLCQHPNSGAAVCARQNSLNRFGAKAV